MEKVCRERHIDFFHLFMEDKDDPIRVSLHPLQPSHKPLKSEIINP